MTPLTILAPQTLASILRTDGALDAEIAAFDGSLGYALPGIPDDRIILSLADSDTVDRRQQISYPRIAIYADRVVNNGREKFRTLSGTVSLTIAVATSADLVEQAEQQLHFYVEAITNVLGRQAGDWGSGMFFAGSYDVQLQSPKTGGSGFVQAANITCILGVSRN